MRACCEPARGIAAFGNTALVAQAQLGSAFDIRHRYHTISLLVVPLLDRNRRTIAVMQLVNKVRDVNGSRRFAP